MPRIVMVNTVASGSHGRLMCDLRTAAAPKGFTSILAHGRGPSPEGEVLRIGTQRDILLHVALTRALDRHARGSRGATRAFVQALDALGPDLLHLHNVHGYYLHAETLFDYIDRKNLPTLWTHHDCWALTGHCSHFTRAGCGRWRIGCYGCPLKKEYPASYGLDASKENYRWKQAAFTAPGSLRIVSPSHWLDGILAQSTLRDIPREVIENGVDLTLFMPTEDAVDRVRAQAKVPDGERMLLAVAAPFDARKGYADALAIAGRLRGKARLVLVGVSEAQLKTLPDTVTGIARTEGPEALVALYQAADCLINPTYEDTYPTVNMEAIACGTPVAGYATGGATEQLDGACGVAVPTGDMQALADAAMALADHGESLKDSCRQYALAHFDRQVALAKYIDRYHTMTGA